MEEDKLKRVIELQANLLIRLIPNLSDDDQAEVLLVQQEAQAVLGGKTKKPNPPKGRKFRQVDAGRKKTKQQRGKSWEGEIF